MFSKAKRGEGYPRQFWLLFVGVFFNRAANSMIWPFLTIYMFSVLEVPLTTVSLLLSLRALTTIFSTGIQSTIMDRVGRKGVIVVSLFGTALVFVGMALAQSMAAWVVLVIAHGIFLPALSTGVNTVVTDLTPPERRTDAFALIRTIANAGFGIGPVIGGFLAGVDYGLAFFSAALMFSVLGVLMSLFIQESRPLELEHKRKTEHGTQWGGYGVILQDKRFLAFCFAFLLMEMGYIQSFSMLSVYTHEVYDLPSAQFGWVVTVNAALVVFFQVSVTRFTRRYNPYVVMVGGAMLMSAGLWSITLGSILPHFMFSMALMTLGELTNSPTGLGVVSGYAPDDMRARYMGVYDLCVQIASGIGPVIGGIMFDSGTPQAMWWAASGLALAGAGCFALLYVRLGVPQVRVSGD